MKMKSVLGGVSRLGIQGVLVVVGLAFSSLSADATDFGALSKSIEFTTSGYTGTSTLTDFPVLVRLAAGSPAGFSYSDCASGGGDLRFSDAAGNLIPHEIEKWDADGTSVVWVKVTVEGNETSFTMHYGGDASALAVTAADTWNSDYVGVWHMGETGGGLVDATGHGLVALQKGTTTSVQTSTAGAIGGGRVNGTTTSRTYFEVADSSLLDVGDTFTISGWYNMSAANASAAATIVGRQYGWYSTDGWMFEMAKSATAFSARGASNSSNNMNAEGSMPSALNDWVHFALVYNGAGVTVYANGEPVTTSGAINAAKDNNTAMDFGYANTRSYFYGAFDEFRLRDAVASADWVKAEYDQAGGSFLSVGAHPDPQDDPSDPEGRETAYDTYPTGADKVPTGYVVTYVATDAAKPYHVVPADVYNGKVVVSPSTGQTFCYRDEADFEANASATIGDTYYLFLADAVRAAVSNDTIEVIRDNDRVAGTMAIAIPLTINGNGHTVKVSRPFVNEEGYVDSECTATPKIVFQIKNGGDVVLRDMTVMGGGERLTGNNPGANTAATPAIVVGETQVLGQTEATGLLQMENVTVMRSQGGLYTAPGTRTYLDRCQIVRNCRYCAGGIYNSGMLVMNKSSLSENRSLATAGGGGAAENQGVMYVSNCVICNNSSTEVGGAISNYSFTYPIAFYMMNSTLSGNFTTQKNNKGSVGGGIGLRAHITGGFFAVNNIVCNNYYYDIESGSVEISDIRSLADGKPSGEFIYGVYGDYVKYGDATIEFRSNNQIDYTDRNVFLDYYADSRVYQNLNDTEVAIDGARLYSDTTQPLARYAPINPNGKAILGDEGVYTYFNADGWRTGDVRMSYRTLNGEMTPLGDAAAAAETDLVTTFYESEIVPDTIERSIGIAGACGLVVGDAKQWSIKLCEATQHGRAENIAQQAMSYPEGTKVTITAIPDFGYAFVGWYDATNHMWSESAAYTVTMDRDWEFKAIFKSTESIELKVRCERTAGKHDEFPIKVTRDWLAKAGIIATEDAEIDKASVEAALNAPDTNGLDHVWQDYVLGLNKGDQKGRIWINAEQTRDADNIRFKTETFAPLTDRGFTVKFRLDAKSAGEGWSRTSVENKDANLKSGQFDVAADGNASGRYVIDLIFIPDGFAASEEYVTTVNTAGVLKVESSKSVEILASPWAGFSPTNNPAVKASEFAKSACLSVNDVLYVYDRENQNYLAWAVQPNGTWAAVKTYTLANGVVTESAADATRTNDIPRGAGVWLERKDTTKPIFLYGQVDASPVTTSLESGYNLVANPYPTAFDASTLAAPTKTGDDGDCIVIPTGGAPINAYYKDGAWKTPHNREVTITNPFTGEEMTGFKTEWSSEGLTLPAGCGFWYFNAGSESVELTWPAGE